MPTSPDIYQPDKLDREILEELARDARTPYTEIARKLVVSPGTIHVRMRKMEDNGLVRGAHLVLDSTKLGYDLTAFIGVYLGKGSEYRQVKAALESIPEITEAHYTTGQYGIFVKVVCRNTEHLRKVLNERIQAIDGIQRTETFISLETGIYRQPSLVGNS